MSCVTLSTIVNMIDVGDRLGLARRIARLYEALVTVHQTLAVRQNLSTRVGFLESTLQNYFVALMGISRIPSVAFDRVGSELKVWSLHRSGSGAIQRLIIVSATSVSLYGRVHDESRLVSGRVRLHHKACIAHSLDPPLQVDLSPLDLLLLIIDTGTRQQVEHQEYQTHYDDDADGQVCVHIKHILVISFRQVDKTCLFLLLSKAIIAGLIVNGVDQTVVNVLALVDIVVTGDVVVLDEVRDELVPHGHLVRPVVCPHLWLEVQQ